MFPFLFLLLSSQILLNECLIKLEFKFDIENNFANVFLVNRKILMKW